MENENRIQTEAAEGGEGGGECREEVGTSRSSPLARARAEGTGQRIDVREGGARAASEAEASGEGGATARPRDVCDETLCRDTLHIRHLKKLKKTKGTRE